MKPAKPGIVFDFDGVLANSFDELYKLNRDGLAALGLPFSVQDYRGLFEENVHQSLKKRVPDPEKYAAFLEFKKQRYLQHYAGIDLFPSAPGIIQTLSRNYALGIVSSTPKQSILSLLDRHSLAGHFASVFGSEAESKESELAHTLEIFKAAAGDTYFVTDTVGDIRVGQKLGLRTAAAGWGFHEREHLASAGPERVFAQPKDLLDFFASNAQNKKMAG